MFNLKTSDIYIKVNFWKRFALTILNILLSTYIFFSFSILYQYQSNDIYLMNIFIIIGWINFQIVFNSIFNFVLKKYLAKKTTIELWEILQNSKLPKDLPKVVYVYTTHNDFWESRLLQSMRQTYSNIEYWISDGSSNPEIINKIKTFAKRHKINYHSLNRPSIHKADNLNHFLKHSGAKFDYLLISDSDVAIDSNFVETSLKFFYSKNQKRLGWVSSLLQNYKTNNLYSNLLKDIENVGFVTDEYYRDFKSNFSINLYSSTCLIKKEMLNEFDLEFPNSCLEDAWLEFLATKNYWVGLINPFTVSLQSFDTNIESTFKRYYRISDWSIKYFKENYFTKQNETKTESNKRAFEGIVVSQLFNFFKIIILITTCFFLTNYWTKIISNNGYVYILVMFLSSFAVSTLIKFINVISVVKIRNVLLFYILHILFAISYTCYSSINFFKAFFGSKYATFTPTRSNLKHQNSFFNRNRKYILVFITTSILLITINLSFGLAKTFNKNLYLSFIFIFLNVIIGWMWFATLCYWILYSLSLIKSNSTYNPNDFVFSTILKKLRYEYLEKHNKFSQFK